MQRTTTTRTLTSAVLLTLGAAWFSLSTGCVGTSDRCSNPGGVQTCTCGPSSQGTPLHGTQACLADGSWAPCNCHSACQPVAGSPVMLYMACGSDAACGDGLTCQGVCGPFCCTTDADCPAAPTGVTGVPFCSVIDVVGSCQLGCRTTSDCLAGERCTSGGSGPDYCIAW